VKVQIVDFPETLNETGRTRWAVRPVVTAVPGVVQGVVPTTLAPRIMLGCTGSDAI